jgi:hypothetical protein
MTPESPPLEETSKPEVPYVEVGAADEGSSGASPRVADWIDAAEIE